MANTNWTKEELVAYILLFISNSDFTVRTTNIDKLQKALSQSLELLSKGILNFICSCISNEVFWVLHRGIFLFKV